MTRTGARTLVVFAPGLSEVGGAAKQSRLLLTGLEERGWKIFAVARAGTFRRFRLWKRGGLRVLEVPGFDRPRLGAWLYVIVALFTGLLRKPPTAYISIQLLSPTTVAGICSAIARRPFVAWPTTSGPFSEAAYVARSRTSWLRRALLRRASWLVAQSPLTARELASMVDASRVVDIPNPVEPISAPPLSGRPRAIYTGRLSEEKDLVRLLDAWKIASSGDATASLTLVGEGGRFRSVESELRERVAEDPELVASVSFTGWVEDISLHMASSDVYVFPSLTEGMSNALVEACAWGRVVVASDIEPNRFLLGDDYPLLFRAGDTESLIDKLRGALFDETVRKQVQPRIAQAASACSIDAVVDRWEQLISASSRSRN